MAPQQEEVNDESSLHEPLLDPEQTKAPQVDDDALSQHSVTLDDNTGDDCAEEQERLVMSPEEQVEEPPVVSGEARTKALAFAKTTPLIVKLVMPLLIISCHGLFLYGQIKPMWRLSEHIDIDVVTTAHGNEAKMAVDALKLPHTNHFVVKKDKNVKTFTYSYAIQELWRAKHMPGKFLPRLAAMLLFLFSGVWPHAKLLLLLLTWFFSKRQVRRKRILNTLGVLGKWSLVDVLVVCVMVGVLNLRWEIDGPVVLSRIVDHLPMVATLVSTLYTSQSICSEALNYSCVSPSKPKHIMQCKACLSTVRTFFKYPEKSGKPIMKGFESTGGGEAELYVAGLKGIYFFCGAVILSILLSLIVDWYDHVARLDKEDDQGIQAGESDSLIPRERLGTEEVSTTPEITGTLNAATTQPANQEETPYRYSMETLTVPSGVDYRSAVDREFDDRLLHARQNKGRGCRMALSFITAACVSVAVASTSLQRNVNGALPTLIHEILGIEWTRSYSIFELAWTTGKAGGLDWMLMGTFALFMVFGPLIRSIMCFAVMVRKAGGQHGRKTLTAVDFIGAFCAWEVFAAALVMVDLLMPAITSTIFIDPRCSTLTADSSCLEVEFNMLQSFGLVLGGGILLLLVSAHIKWRNALY